MCLLIPVSNDMSNRWYSTISCNNLKIRIYDTVIWKSRIDWVNAKKPEDLGVMKNLTDWWAYVQGWALSECQHPWLVAGEHQ